MMSDTKVPLGFETVDEVEGKHVVVLEDTGETAEERVYTYDFNMNPKTIADANEEHGYSPDERVVLVAFVETLDRRIPDWRSLTYDELQEAVEERNVKKYGFPLSRVNDRVDGGYRGLGD